MDRGYIRVWRSVRDKGFLEDGPLLQVFIKALLDAEFKKVQRKVGSKFVSLEPGEFVFGRTAWAKGLTLPENQVRTRINVLEQMGTISTSKTASTYTVYRFNNWENYAGKSEDYHPHITPHPTNKPPASRQQATIYEEAKKLRKEDTDVSYSQGPTHNTEPNILITIPLKDGSEFAVTEEFAQEMARLHPTLDVRQSLRSIRAWNLANPSKRKTNKGIKKHITNWLSKELVRSDKPRGGHGTGLPRHTQNNLAVINKLMEED